MSASGQIQALEKTSVHKICSGQVIVNLETAVKELVENSLDAKADSIEVRVRDHGKESIEVVDNGHGVEEKNYEALALKHHTSKIRHFDDLSGVVTFGFRGEALSSICALSCVTITTRHVTAAVGHRIEFDHNGVMTKKAPCSREPGTTVLIRNIFYTLPVRHKEFVKNAKKEFDKMVRALTAYCLVKTGLKLHCCHISSQGKKSSILNLNGNASVYANITNVFGYSQMESLREFVQIEPCELDKERNEESAEKLVQTIPFRINGFISTIDHGKGRRSPDRQFHFINGRPCDLTKLSRLINDVYHQYNRNQYPFFLLDIRTDEGTVDVNVTPDKRQILLQNESLLLSVVKLSLTKMYDSSICSYPTSNPNPVRASKRSPDKFFDQSPDKSSFLMKWKQNATSLCVKSNETVLKQTARPPVTTFRSGLETVKIFERTPKFQPGSTESDGTGSYLESDELPKLTPTLRFERYEFTASKSGNEDIERINKRTPTKLGVNLQQSKCLDLESETSSRVKGIDTDLRFDLSTESPFPKSDEPINTKTYSLKPYDLEIANNEHNFDKFVNMAEMDSGYAESSHHETAWNYSVRPATADFSVSNGNLNEMVSQKKIRKIERQSAEHGENMPVNYSAEAVVTFTVHGERAALTSPETLRNDEPDANFCKSERRRTNVNFCLEALQDRCRKRSVHSRAVVSEERRFRATICPSENQQAEQELHKQISKQSFKEMEVLGQFNLGFIIARLQNELFIVDQHASDEKYNFETLQKTTKLGSQALVAPQDLHLSSVDESLLMEHIQIFRMNGFDFSIDPDAPHTKKVKLISRPVSRQFQLGKSDIDELLFMLRETPGEMCRPSRIREMFASRACRKSVMIGTALSRKEMEKLLVHMSEIDQPWNCPHGRPTMRHLIDLNMIER